MPRGEKDHDYTKVIYWKNTQIIEGRITKSEVRQRTDEHRHAGAGGGGLGGLGGLQPPHFLSLCYVEGIRL